MVRKTFIIFALCMSAFVPAQAHHSFAAFDRDNPVTLEGVITAVKWINPHSWIYVDVKDPKTGEVVNWGFESVSPAQFASRVSPSLLKPGVHIIVKGSGPRDRSQHIASFDQFILDGKTYDPMRAAGREGRGGN